MLGGAWFESSLGDLESVHPEKILGLATAAAATQLGVKEKPSRAIVSINKVEEGCGGGLNGDLRSEIYRKHITFVPSF